MSGANTGVRQKLLLAGCGRLGRELARTLSADDYHITALSRRKISDPNIDASFAGDLTAPPSLSGLSRDFDVVIYSPTPDKRSADAYQKTYYQGLKNLLRRSAPRPGGRLVFVSSTAVYGQDDGSIVTEDSDTNPKRFNGQIMLEAEQLAQNLRAQDCRTTVVRLGGLYGEPNNYLIRRLLDGQTDTDKLHQWTNRIHLNDAAGLIAHWLRQEDSPALVNGVDNSPSLRLEMLTWLSEQLLKIRPVKELEKQLKHFHKQSPDGAPHTGKRISNQRARDAGYVFQHPDYRSGYTPILQALHPDKHG